MSNWEVSRGRIKNTYQTKHECSTMDDGDDDGSMDEYDVTMDIF